MKTTAFLLLIFLLVFSLKASAQSVTIAPAGCPVSMDSDYNRKLYIFVDSMPQFPGGETAYNDYLSKNIRVIKIPPGCIPQKIYSSFVIEHDGKIIDKRIERGSGCDAVDYDVLALISGMPIWKPGQCGGKAVPVKIMLPLSIEPR